MFDTGSDVLLFLIAAAIAGWIAFPTQVRVKRAGMRFARDNFAYVDAQFVDAFNRAYVLERRVMAGLFLGTAVGALLWAADGYGPLVISVAAALSSLFRLVRAGREFSPPSGRAAVARSRAVRVIDYLHPGLLWVGAVLALLAAGAGIATVLSAASGTSEISGYQASTIALVALMVAALAPLAYLYFRVLCRRPEPAVDAAHLYLQDAWRSEQMDAVVTHGMIATVLAVLPVWADSSYLLQLILLIPLAVLGFWIDRKNELRFRKQLWPMLGPGQIIMPGEFLVESRR